MNNYYLKPDDEVPKPTLQYVIKYNKALKSISITYKSKGNAKANNTVTISDNLDNRVCTCDTYRRHGECYHADNGLSLLEAAFAVITDNEIPDVLPSTYLLPQI